MKKRLYVTIKTGQAELNLYLTNIRYRCEVKYTISFDYSEGYSAMCMSSKDFWHKLRYKFESDCVKYYELDLR
ncbi:hypothetical protein [Sedimentibacter sp.]|uniref:hypothetical protein n=1 Tax=Sedimentibacter sp. TaxID=1960295 RepID=UPI0028AA546A|nr:hypothetical protein [Sedimentibacter sp.]